MPIVTIEFNLPEEANEANAAQHGEKLISILAELDNEIRSLIKYQDGDTVEKTELERLRHLINESCGDAGICLF